jgi:hypothetical protein
LKPAGSIRMLRDSTPAFCKPDAIRRNRILT